MLQELEAPLHPKQKKQVLEAIHSLGLKVSPSEVAALANVPVLVATQQLNHIATETSAHLEVSDKGNVTYCFPPAFERAYTMRGPAGWMKTIGRVVLNSIQLVLTMAFLASFFILRMSFGILLVTSVFGIIAIVVAIVIIVPLLFLLSLFSDSGGGDAGGIDLDLSGLGDFDLSFLSCGPVYVDRPFWLYWSIDWMWDWIYFGDYLWGPSYGSAYTPLPYNLATISDKVATTKKEKKKSKFLDHCYTLLFGAGDPNASIDQRRWLEVSQVIRLNSGVVTCEQVAPYLNSNTVNEDWMLPVLQRFNGSPEVTENGNIIYVFPAFQQKAALEAPSTQAGIVDQNPEQIDVNALRSLYAGHLKRQKVIKQSDSAKLVLPPYLNEERWTIGLTAEEIVPVLTFAAIAVGGAYALICFQVKLPFLHVIQPELLTVMGYAALFFVIPAIRWAFNRMMNQSVNQRNEQRAELARQIASPSEELKLKLSEARAESIRALSSEEHMAFTTEQDALEQQFPVA